MDTPFSSEGGGSPEPASFVVWLILLACLVLVFQLLAPVLAAVAGLVGLIGPLLPLLVVVGVVLYLVKN